jgi:uncharacterized membrane protein
MSELNDAPPDDIIPEVVARNIASIGRWKEDRRAKQSAGDKIAGSVSAFAGSMTFVYIHMLLFGAWIAINVGWVPVVPRFDPSLVVLAMVASVEAIFLSTFVLINQNQMAAEVEDRAELDLQVSLLNERETTRLIAMTQAIADHLGIKTGVEEDVAELRRDTQPHVILEAVSSDRSSDKS